MSAQIRLWILRKREAECWYRDKSASLYINAFSRFHFCNDNNLVRLLRVPAKSKRQKYETLYLHAEKGDIHTQCVIGHEIWTRAFGSSRQRVAATFRRISSCSSENISDILYIYIGERRGSKKSRERVAFHLRRDSATSYRTGAGFIVSRSSVARTKNPRVRIRRNNRGKIYESGRVGNFGHVTRYPP